MLFSSTATFALFLFFVNEYWCRTCWQNGVKLVCGCVPACENEKCHVSIMLAESWLNHGEVKTIALTRLTAFCQEPFVSNTSQHMRHELWHWEIMSKKGLAKTNSILFQDKMWTDYKCVYSFHVYFDIFKSHMYGGEKIITIFYEYFLMQMHACVQKTLYFKK